MVEHKMLVAGLLNKSSGLDAALGVTKFTAKFITLSIILFQEN
jgi:hypothetical protein